LDHKTFMNRWQTHNVKTNSDSEYVISSLQGIYVTEIHPESPASKSGLRVHDKILQCNGYDFTMVKNIHFQCCKFQIVKCTSKKKRSIHFLVSTLAAYIFFIFVNEPGLGTLMDLAWLWHHFHLVLDKMRFEPTTFLLRI